MEDNPMVERKRECLSSCQECRVRNEMASYSQVPSPKTHGRQDSKTQGDPAWRCTRCCEGLVPSAPPSREVRTLLLSKGKGFDYRQEIIRISQSQMRYNTFLGTLHVFSQYLCTKIKNRFTLYIPASISDLEDKKWTGDRTGAAGCT